MEDSTKYKLTFKAGKRGVLLHPPCGEGSMGMTVTLVTPSEKQLRSQNVSFESQRVSSCNPVHFFAAELII